MGNTRYKFIFFDLDGTLVDSGEGITRSVEFALRHFGIEPRTKEELYRFIGPPLVDSFMRFYGFSKEKAGEAVDVYRSRYASVGVHENTVYPGIPELLLRLNERGCLCAVATSKPEVFANIVIDDIGVRPYLAGVFGAELDDAEGRKRGHLRSAKADVIAYALERLGVTDKSGVLMVGDRKHDIEGAKANGIDSCGVLFGFGSREELNAAEADHLAAAPADIEEIVI